MEKILFLIVVIASCRNHNYTIIINDLSKDTVIDKITNKNTPTTLLLSIKGWSDDTCIINNMKINSGHIDTTFNLDWYTRKTVIKYQAYKAKRGKLEINYSIL